jgi:acylphosphatase
MTALRLVVSGRVQGVGFRAWTARRAGDYGVSGWVRNLPDGTVEALLIGDETAVTAMAAACANGPRLAEVTQVDRFPAEDDGSRDFRQIG